MRMIVREGTLEGTKHVFVVGEKKKNASRLKTSGDIAEGCYYKSAT